MGRGPAGAAAAADVLLFAVTFCYLLFFGKRASLCLLSPQTAAGSAVGRDPSRTERPAPGALRGWGRGSPCPGPRARGLRPGRPRPRAGPDLTWAGRPPPAGGHRRHSSSRLGGPRDTSLSHGSQSLGEAVRLRTAAPSGAQFAGRRASYFPLGAAVPLLGHTGRLDQMTPQSSQFLPPCKPGCACPRDPANARARGGGAGPAAWGTQDAWQNLPVLQVS